MRVLLPTVVAVGSVLIGQVSGPAGAATDPSVDQLQSQLARSHAHLNTLYDQAAQSGQRFTAALEGVRTADRAVARERRAAKRARAELADESAAVAAMTVQQLQTQSGSAPWWTSIGRAEPRDLLERQSAYQSTAEAMTAKIDQLSAQKTVHEAAQRRLESALRGQRQALARESDARAAINAAIAKSQRTTMAAEAERDRLLRQLAERQNKSLQTVTEQQDAIDARIDASQSGTPAASAGPAEPPPAAGPTPTPSMSVPTPPPVVTPAPAVPVQGPGEEYAPAEPYGVWDKIAKCESGGNWHINTGNGYYGGLQFSARTWHSVGGPGLPHEYSREVQIKYAKILQKRSGWGQWSCGGARH